MKEPFLKFLPSLKFSSKQEVRDLAQKRTLNCSEEHRHLFSQQACRFLFENQRFQSAETIMLFSSLPDEIDTSFLLQKLHDTTNKQVLLPVLSDNEMVPVLFHRGGQLKKGLFGILEPELHPFHGVIDVVITPGLAFDVNGNRVGRGKGFYDRFFSQKNCYKIGFCYSFQFFEKIPFDSNDICVDEVVTDDYYQIS